TYLSYCNLFYSCLLVKNVLKARVAMDYIPKVRPKIRKKRKKEHFYKIIKAKNSNEIYYLGEIWFGKTNNIFPSTWGTCRASITSNDEDDTDKLFLNFDSCVVVITITTQMEFLKGILSVNVFSMDFKLCDENAFVLLYLNKMPLQKFYPKIGSVMKTVFSLIFDISCDYNEIQTIKSSSVIESFNELYKNVNRYHGELSQVDPQHEKLKPTLRRYQRNAVQWMIQREQKPSEDEMLHPLYEEITLKSGVKIYFDKYTGYIDVSKPMTTSLRTGGILADEMGLGKTVEVLACMLSHPHEHLKLRDIKAFKRDTTWPVITKQTRKRELKFDKVEKTPELNVFPKKLKIPEDWVKGSSKKSSLRIALDSWYLSQLNTTPREIEIPKVQCICGSTDETTDCVECVDCSKIQHGKCLGYRSKNGPYICPQCWMIRPPLESGATLIVTPYSLKQQWCDEIIKHVDGAFKVFLYEGVQNRIPVYPTILLQYDLVITTYTVLQNELRLSENGQAVSLRRPRKYSLPGSPITLINWWRLCLDEAQTVETPRCMVSEMARRIHACHRWAVTGTPISKDISDLYGLVDYLHFAPYSDFDTWNNLYYKPYINGRKESMHKFLSKILWRTAKSDVINQINIPQQTIVVHWLDFSDVETFFYEREHNLCSKEFLHRLREMNLDMLLYSLNKSCFKKLIQPLLALRQACCHHQAVKSKYIATRKKVDSMEDLLNALIGKNISENEEYLRIIISSLNGLAGVYLLLQNPI
ncbi:PHD finger motif containing protein, partial [Oryctes borbonicus]